MKHCFLVIAGFLFTASLSAGAATLTGRVQAGNSLFAATPGTSVVYIDAAPGRVSPVAAGKVFVIDQKRMEFVPRVLAVPLGATVKFTNEDAVLHNVYWPSVGAHKKWGHNLGTFPRGQAREFTFHHAGVVPLLCNIHPNMSAYIVVSPTPYYAVTDAKGQFSIRNIPPGTYKITAWQPEKKPETKTVRVAGTSTVDFTLAG